MGLFLSKLTQLFEDWGTTQARVLMLGLDAAGKHYSSLQKLFINCMVICSIELISKYVLIHIFSKKNNYLKL